MREIAGTYGELSGLIVKADMKDVDGIFGGGYFDCPRGTEHTVHEAGEATLLPRRQGAEPTTFGRMTLGAGSAAFRARGSDFHDAPPALAEALRLPDLARRIIGRGLGVLQGRGLKWLGAGDVAGGTAGGFAGPAERGKEAGCVKGGADQVVSRTVATIVAGRRGRRPGVRGVGQGGGGGGGAVVGVGYARRRQGGVLPGRRRRGAVGARLGAVVKVAAGVRGRGVGTGEGRCRGMTLEGAVGLGLPERGSTVEERGRRRLGQSNAFSCRLVAVSAQVVHGQRAR